jgi:hexokinase
LLTHSRYLAIDIGGTNLRVGFIELLSLDEDDADVSLSNGITSDSLLHESRVRGRLEKSWPIGEQLKHEKAEHLFAWVGERIAEVVEDGIKEFGSDILADLPLGVTFSFPMM